MILIAPTLTGETGPFSLKIFLPPTTLFFTTTKHPRAHIYSLELFYTQ